MLLTAVVAAFLGVFTVLLLLAAEGLGEGTMLPVVTGIAAVVLFRAARRMRAR